MGFSLGAASCIIATAKNKNINGLITVSAPISFEKIENRFLYKDALISGIQKFGNHTLKMRLGNMFAKKEKPIDVIDSISPIPILLIQGENDPIIFKHHAQTLYEKAKNPKKLMMIKEGLHAEDLYINKPKEFVSLCGSWLKELIP
jgi:esterase/lipase